VGVSDNEEKQEFETVTCHVPLGTEGVLRAVAKALREMKQAPTVRGSGQAASRETEPDVGISSIVDEVIAPFLGKVDPAKEQAEDTGSRLGPWRVEYRGVQWGMKSLYYSVQKKTGEDWGSPGAFHSSQARAFWTNHSFQVIHIKG